MILALALAALQQTKSHRSGQHKPTRGKSSRKSAGYETMLCLLMRRNNGSSEIRGNTKELFELGFVATTATGTDSAPAAAKKAGISSLNCAGPSGSAPFLFPFITKTFSSRTAAVVGAVNNNGPQPSSTLSSGDEA